MATEPLHLAVAQEDPRHGVVDLVSCSDDAWIAAPGDTYFGQAVRSMCRRVGFEPPVVHAVADTGACLAMAAAGLGVTPATRMRYEVRAAGLRLIGVSPIETREIVLLSRAGRTASPLRQVLVEVLQEVVAPYDEAQSASR